MENFSQNNQKSQSGEKRAWLIWLCAALFYFYVFLLRVSPSIMTDDWMSTFGIEAAALGAISSLYFLAYVGIQLPLGVMMDRIGPRKILSLAAIVCAGGCVVIATAQSAMGTLWGRGLVGLGSACGFLGTMKLATLWFHQNKLGLIATITTGLGTFGAIMGGAPLSLLNRIVGWRFSMALLAILGVMISLLIWIFVRDEPKKTSEKEGEQLKQKALLQGIRQAFATPLLWYVSIYGMFMYMPLTGFADLWGVPFLQAVYGISEPAASSVNSMIFIGIVGGGPLVAALSEKLCSRRIPMGVGALCSCICFVFILYAPLSLTMMSSMLFLAGVFFTAECLCFVVGCELLPRDMGGVAVSFNNMLIMMNGLVAQPLIGWFLTRFGTSTLVNGAPVYAAGDYRLAMLFIPIFLGIAAVMVLFFKETYQK